MLWKCPSLLRSSFVPTPSERKIILSTCSSSKTALLLEIIPQPKQGQLQMATARKEKPKRLRRHEVSTYLKKRHGITRTTESLAVEACKGSGPKYIRIGRLTFYDPIDVDAWVRAKTSIGKSQRKAPKLSEGAA